MKMNKLAAFWYVPVMLGIAFILAFASLQANSPQMPANAANLVFRSANGGQSWQDISKVLAPARLSHSGGSDAFGGGLPGNRQQDGIRGNSILANDKGLFVKGTNGLYLSTPLATAPFWVKASPADSLWFIAEQQRLASGKSGMAVNRYWGINLVKADGTSVWSPMFGNGSEPRLRSVFETSRGAIFIGTDQGFFKTANNGKTWKQVYAGGWAGNMAESNGVLVSTSKRKIIRSTDGGENWEPVVSEGGITWDVKPYKAGFVAIISGSDSDARNLKTSDDGGLTWKPMDAILDKMAIGSIGQTWNNRPHVKAIQTSIIGVGENFYCEHPEGIFESSDKGATWELVLPAVKGKRFNLFNSGNVVYAVTAMSKDC